MVGFDEVPKRKLIWRPKATQPMPQTHANSPRAEQPAKAVKRAALQAVKETVEQPKMSRKQWDEARKASKAVPVSMSKPQAVCYSCGSVGHTKSECLSRGLNKNDHDRERVKNKRDQGRRQRQCADLVKCADYSLKHDFDSTKVYCEDEIIFDISERSYNKKTGKPCLWQPAKVESLSVIDKDEHPGNYEPEEVLVQDVDSHPEAKKTEPTLIPEAELIPVGYKWKWRDDENWLSYSCVMEKIDSSSLPVPLTDKRPDQFRGAEMVHKEPKYSFIKYTRTPVFASMSYWVSSETILCVSEEVATQIITASNATYNYDQATIFNRITQAAKTVAKVNEDRYMTLNGYFPRNDTIVFANNLAKSYFYARRNLKENVDFIRCQDAVKSSLTDIVPKKSIYQPHLTLKMALLCICAGAMTIRYRGLLSELASAATYLALPTLTRILAI